MVEDEAGGGWGGKPCRQCTDNETGAAEGRQRLEAQASL